MPSRRTVRQIPAWELKPGDVIDTFQGQDTVVEVSRPRKGEFDGDIVYITTESGERLEKDPNDVFVSTTHG